MRLIAESYLTLITDLNHWAFELSVEAVTGAVGFAFGALWVKRHDQRHHAHHEAQEAPSR